MWRIIHATISGNTLGLAPTTIEAELEEPDGKAVRRGVRFLWSGLHPFQAGEVYRLELDPSSPIYDITILGMSPGPIIEALTN
jgi:hypothetical protein